MADDNMSAMLDVVRSGLREVGYRDNLVLPAYAFRDVLSSAAEPGSSVRTIELAAFAQSPPSYRSACFGVTTPADASPEAILPYRSLGAPQVLALHPGRGYAERWKIVASGRPQSLGRIATDDLADTFRRSRAEWEPRRVLEAKSSAFGGNAAQLDFFDAGLLPALEAALRPKLDRELHAILTRCQDAYKEWRPDATIEQVQAPLFRLVFRLIAAKMLIDRGDRPQWADLSAQAVIQNVEAFYFSGEDFEEALGDRPVQTVAWQQIREGLNLQNLSVETLAYIYENTFVTQDVRRRQGVHATPQEVAEYVVRQLPIEQLAERERTVFEPFAGAAPFLIAALGRLRELLPPDRSPADAHDYLVQRLSGIENDPFAREIARYSLILADYPNPNGWRVDSADAFGGPEFDRHLQQARVVLCNPPFGEFTPEERQSLPANALHRKEAEALRRVLLKPPALLGFVLPRTFLNRDVFHSLREGIIMNYSEISVTALPDTVFEKADQEVALLIAHNLRYSGKRFHSAFVSKEDYKNFISTGKPTWEQERTTTSHKSDGDNSLWHTPLQSLWNLLGSYTTLSSYVDIHYGISYKRINNASVSDVDRPGSTPGIQRVRGYLEALLVTNYRYVSTDPQLMSRQREGLDWKSPKIVLNSFRSSRGYWSVVGAVDAQGLVISSQFFGAWPKNNFPIEVIAALISGPVANAYLYEHRAGIDNQIRLLNEIPFPELTQEQIGLIVSLVDRYESYRGQWLAESQHGVRFAHKCLECLCQIDAAVLEAYALPAELEGELLRKFDGAERRPLPFHFPGYGEEYERAKQALQQEKEQRAVSKRYHDLVDKKYATGLTASEADEMERLSDRLDEFDAPFYDPIFETLRSKEQ